MRQQISTTFLMFCLLLGVQSIQAQSTLYGVITGDDGESLIAATVQVIAADAGTITDFEGNYELELPAGDHLVQVSYAGYNTFEQSISLSNGESLNLDVVLSFGLNIDEVVVLGTRASARTQLETTVPIDVIGPEQISSSSQANVTQILQYLAPSFHSTPQTISDGTDHVDPAALRGLGPDQTLVLINGKRRHTSALLNVNGTVGRGTVGTDLNSIPAAAIERIEILRDGAAAQYGSDAIAGVVNIVLKKKTDAVSVNFQTGVTAPNALGGISDNARGNVSEDLIPAFNNDGQLYQVSTNFGFELGEEGGYVNVSAEYTDRSPSNRSGNYTGSIYPDGYDNALSREAFFEAVREETGFVENQVMEIGNSALRNAGAFLNAAYPLKNGAELYGTLGFNYRNGAARGFYRFPSSQNRVVPQVYPNGFSPEVHSDIFDNSFIVGARGEIGGWNVDLSQTRGSNEFQFTVRNSINASLGQGSPLQAYAGGFSYGQNTTNVDFSRQLEAGIPINVAFGGEFRLENYQIFEGEETSYINGGVPNAWPINGQDTLIGGAAGIQVFPGFQPQNALDKSRNSVALYGDLEFDISDAFLIAVAGRYEDYSDFGDTFTWKLASRYRLTNNFSLRASVSTGFRAPSLHQIYFNNLSTQFIADPDTGEQVPVQVGTFNNESAVTKGFGIESLQPETSTNFSLGFTGRLAEGLSLTVDAYSINIDDRIVVSGRFSPGEELAGGVLAGDILTPLGAGAAQFFTNAVSTETRGLDIVGAYRKRIGEGFLNLTLASNFTETEVKRDANGNADIQASDLLEGKENVLFNREEISRIEVAQPKSKVALSAAYEIGKWNFVLRATRFGEITYIHPSDGGDSKDWTTNSFTNEQESRDQVFSAKIVPDLEISYQLCEPLRWTVGAHNFTNTYPDLHQHSGNVSSGRFLFSRRVQQFGVRGMYIYTKLGVAF